jgi:hypothetical protein
MSDDKSAAEDSVGGKRFGTRGGWKALPGKTQMPKLPTGPGPGGAKPATTEAKQDSSDEV